MVRQTYSGRIAREKETAENTDKIALDHLAERIIRGALTVSNTLGVGFLERVHENALLHELRKAGLSAIQQAELNVWYDNIAVGKYSADIIVNNTIIIELKAVSELNDIDRAQCLNYLKATGFRLCLLMNFAKPRLEIKRISLGH